MGLRTTIGIVGIIMSFAATAGRAETTGCGAFEDGAVTSHRQIEWADFQGPRPSRVRGRKARQTPIDAQIATSVRLDRWDVIAEENGAGRWVARIGELCVRAYMYKELSGHHAGTETTRRDLEHEQGHFDITEQTARTLARELRDVETHGADRPEAERRLRDLVKETYRRRMAECIGTQDRYEKETRYGNKRKPQERWLRELADALGGPRVATVQAVSAPGV